MACTQFLNVKEENAEVDQTSDNCEHEVVKSFVNIPYKWLITLGHIGHLGRWNDAKDHTKNEEYDF